MTAFLRVMQSSQPSTPEINSLLVKIRELNQKVPNEQNLMKDFFGKLGLDNLENIGISTSGDILVDVNGVRSVNTNWGNYSAGHFQFNKVQFMYPSKWLFLQKSVAQVSLHTVSLCIKDLL